MKGDDVPVRVARGETRVEPALTIGTEHRAARVRDVLAAAAGAAGLLSGASRVKSATPPGDRAVCP